MNLGTASGHFSEVWIKSEPVEADEAEDEEKEEPTLKLSDGCDKLESWNEDRVIIEPAVELTIDRQAKEYFIPCARGVSMSAPLSNCTVNEQRAVIRFLWSEGVKPAQIHRRMLAQYEDKCINQRKVYEWVTRFKSGRTSVVDEDRSGRPTTSTTVNNVDQVKALIQENRRITISTIARRLNFSYGSAYSLIHDTLKYHKVCARWVPRCLTEQHKQKRMEMCTQFLQRYQDEGEEFLLQIVTGDETWVHHYEPESTQQSLELKHTSSQMSSPKAKKFRSVPSSDKVMLTLFWDLNGPILEHYQDCEETVNSAKYCAMLEEELAPAIHNKKHRDLLSKGILLQHDYGRPHLTAATVKMLEKLNFELLFHPPYSPDLAPSDYHIFGPLRKTLRGRQFANGGEVKDAVHKWLIEQPRTFFLDGIKKLVVRSEKCLENPGDYL